MEILAQEFAEHANNKHKCLGVLTCCDNLSVHAAPEVQDIIHIIYEPKLQNRLNLHVHENKGQFVIIWEISWTHGYQTRRAWKIRKVKHTSNRRVLINHTLVDDPEMAIENGTFCTVYFVIT